jgi:hypothetical protein
MKIQIADGLAFPLDVVTQTVAILAKRRAGKSFLARRFVEQLDAARQQVVIVDPKGDWWGIRASRDGRGPGIPFVILGGEHGDVPLEAAGGELVARLVVEERVSALLDLSLLSKGDVARFMADFLEKVYRLQAREAYRAPMMLVIDEADAIAPQKPQRGEERMLGAANDIVRRGGQRGLGCTLVSQRSAVLNKNVLTQAEVLICLRTISPQDLAALEAWIDVHGSADQRRTLLESLPSLPIGDAWVWSPGWPTERGLFQRVHVLPIATFDSGATPRAGEQRLEPKLLADVDLEGVRRQMAAVLERHQATDPKALRQRVALLEAELARLRAAPAPTLVPTGIQEEIAALREWSEDVRAVVQRTAAGLEAAARDFVQEAAGIVAEHGTALEKFSAELRGVREPEADTRERWRFVKLQGPPDVDVSPAAAPGRRAGSVAARILAALAELEALGSKAPRRELVALLADYSHVNSKGFANALGALSTHGLVAYPERGKVALTPEGRAMTPRVDHPRTDRELQERVVLMLGGVAERILRPLLEIYPGSLAREALAKRAGYEHVNSKGFANAIGRLSGLGFVEYPSRGLVRASALLFPSAG